MTEAYTIEFVGNVKVVRHASGVVDVLTVDILQQEKDNIDNRITELQADSVMISKDITKMSKPPNIVRRTYNALRKRFLVHRVVT